MKQLLVLLLLSAVMSAPAAAQKLNSKNYAPKLMRMPAKPLEGNFKTYSVGFDPDGAKLSSLNTTGTAVAKNFNLQQYERKAAAGDFEVRLLVGPSLPLSKTRKSKKKKGGTKEKPTEYTVYYYEVSYNVPLSYQILDGERNVMREGIIYGTDANQVYSTSEYKSSKALLENWNRNGKKEASKKMRERLSQGVTSLVGKLQSSIDTGRYPAYVGVYSIKKAEKFKVAYLDQLQETTSAAIKAFNEDGDDDAFKAAMTGPLEQWTGEMNKYSPTDKKQKEIYFAHAYNAALTHYLLGDLDQAEAMLKKSEAAGKREATVRQVQSKIDEERTRIAANADVPENFVGTYNSSLAAMQAESAESSPVAFVEGYVMTTGDNKVAGVITRKPSTRNRDVELTYSYIVTQTQPDGSTQDRIIKPEQVKSVMLNGKEFLSIPISVLTFADYPLVEVIATKNGVTLFRQTLDYDGSDMSGAPGYYLMGKGKKKIYDLQSLRWNNTSKAAGKLFGEDCPAVAAGAEAGKYKDNEESYRELVEDISSCN